MQNSLPDTRCLIEAISRALSEYVLETDPQKLFSALLDDVLELTGSEYGFIGRVLFDDNQRPYIKTQALTNIAWNLDTERIYEELKTSGMAFTKLNSLYGHVLTTAKPVIANTPSIDSRSHGLPHGHPPLNAFLGIPIFSVGKFIGVVGIANRSGGYDSQVIEYLQPFMITCGNLICTYDNNTRRREAEQELTRYKGRLEALTRDQESEDEDTTSLILLGLDYKYDLTDKLLSQRDELVLLTRNEGKLLEKLVGSRNKMVKSFDLEALIWKNGVTGDSSLRALVRRLRKKAPGLNIKTVSGIGYMLATQ